MSERSRTMSRVPEKMSFAHAEGVRWLGRPTRTWRGDRGPRALPGRHQIQSGVEPVPGFSGII